MGERRRYSSDPPEGYQQSRAALRDIYGARSINAHAPQANPGENIGAAGSRSSLTPESTWRDRFRPFGSAATQNDSTAPLTGIFHQMASSMFGNPDSAPDSLTRSLLSPPSTDYSFTLGGGAPTIDSAAPISSLTPATDHASRWTQAALAPQPTGRRWSQDVGTVTDTGVHTLVMPGTGAAVTRTTISTPNGLGYTLGPMSAGEKSNIETMYAPKDKAGTPMPVVGYASPPVKKATLAPALDPRDYALQRKMRWGGGY